MVKQVIHYSDGTETVINYRGVIENGVLTTNEELEEQEKPKAVRKPKTLVQKVKDIIKKK